MKSCNYGWDTEIRYGWSCMEWNKLSPTILEYSKNRKLENLISEGISTSHRNLEITVFSLVSQYNSYSWSFVQVHWNPEQTHFSYPKRQCTSLCPLMPIFFHKKFTCCYCMDSSFDFGSYWWHHILSPVMMQSRNLTVSLVVIHEVLTDFISCSVLWYLNIFLNVLKLEFSSIYNSLAVNWHLV